MRGQQETDISNTDTITTGADPAAVATGIPPQQQQRIKDNEQPEKQRVTTRRHFLNPFYIYFFVNQLTETQQSHSQVYIKITIQLWQIHILAFM